MEEEFEIIKEKQKRLAKKIWDISFASSNFDKLTKKELLILIDAILVKIEKAEWSELDLKDFMFEQKCILIECLDEEFFNREK